MEADFQSTAGDARPFLFDKMLSVAALLHILDNASKELHNSLKDFTRCMVFINSLMDLLCYEGPRQAFVERVVKGGGASTIALFTLRKRSHYIPNTGGLHCSIQ